MDFEFALWQAVYLIVNPQVVYRNFHYRKQTKNQYARDDPAFLVLGKEVNFGSFNKNEFSINISFIYIGLFRPGDGSRPAGHFRIDFMGNFCRFYLLWNDCRLINVVLM